MWLKRMFQTSVCQAEKPWPSRKPSNAFSMRRNSCSRKRLRRNLVASDHQQGRGQPGGGELSLRFEEGADPGGVLALPRAILRQPGKGAGSSPGQARGPARHPGGPPAPAGVPGDGGEARSGNDLSIFMRLLGLAFSQSQGHLRKYLEEVYGKVFRRYMLLVNEAAPKLPPIELFWRVHFMPAQPPSACRGSGPAGDGGNRFRREHFHRAGDAPDGAVLRCRHARRERHRRSAAGRAQLRPRNKTPAKA